MVLSFFGAVLLLGSFSINVVFPLVLQSGTCASGRVLFISSASMSWMELNFWNQSTCIQSCPGVFQFDIFYSVFFSISMRISAVGPSSSSSSSLVISFIHSSFSLFFFSCYIFVQNCSVSLAYGCWYVFFPPLLVFYRIFFYCFGMSCFVYIVFTFVYISLISHLSPVLSGLIPQVLLLFFLVLSFAFCSHIYQDLPVLPFWPVFVDFLSGFPVEFSILVLTVSSCFLRGP